MLYQDEVFMRAFELGCTPVRVGFKWECRCPRSEHGTSRVDPEITKASLERFEVNYR